MNDEDIKFKLLGNMGIHIEGAGDIHIPSLNEIFQLNMSTYNEYLSSLLIDKSAFDTEIDEKISNYDVFIVNCYHNYSFKEISFKAISFFFKCKPSLVMEGEEVIVELADGKIDRTNFPLLQKVLKMGNNVKLTPPEPEYKPANSRAKKMIEMIMKNKKNKPPPKEKMDLFSIVSGLVWKNNSQNLESILSMNIFQIYNGLHTTDKIENVHHTVTAIYAGKIDSKKIKLSDLHWANKME
ncbi:hypothetical protein [Paenibacillus illinoisensis]|uniref:Uncharacterized protein n=1 Tax=Paenibacillus illinoisensis TaxID=59845 RepID=A0A2W0CKK7_9BACL|nr:hypothetical protein [Paenibacillus illinoisensis]PYY28358.1 Uncharacterized protein PIL02S_03509 [Paenibacillus illinoisensis]